jgi:hypothetical protein
MTSSCSVAYECSGAVSAWKHEGRGIESGQAAVYINVWLDRCIRFAVHWKLYFIELDQVRMYLFFTTW